MKNFSTREAARNLGIAHTTLAQYIRVGKVPAPHSITSGGTTVHIWSKEEVEHVRKLLPKIANGRKTRWARQRAAEKKMQQTKKKK